MTTILPALGDGPAGAAGDAPVLRLRAATDQVTLYRQGDGRVSLDLGTHVVAGAEPFEIWAKRASYRKPIVGRWVRQSGQEPRLPEGLLDRFSGLSNFLHVRISDEAGEPVTQLQQPFCPNRSEARRSRLDAPATSPYPDDCPRHPLTLGAVWGIQTGWAVPTYNSSQKRVQLDRGRYTATVVISRTYRDFFGISRRSGSVTLGLTVKREQACEDHCHGGARGSASADEVALQPHALEPAATSAVPADIPLPDLRPLPAFGIKVMGGDNLIFAANVWNAGPSPLVVDGFRRDGEDVMDAYQYFYDEQGNEVGSTRSGTMEWDGRDGHTHWHFKDFARYRLLDRDKQIAVKSRKEAFCLANTDAVDYTVAGANWHPLGTNLRTACGDYGSLAVREVLDAGSGDTYWQLLPGQSFRLEGLPNGKYFIEVTANPKNRLSEGDQTNNVSYRPVWIGGTPGERTVRVKPVGLVDVR